MHTLLLAGHCRPLCRLCVLLLVVVADWRREGQWESRAKARGRFSNRLLLWLQAGGFRLAAVHCSFLTSSFSFFYLFQFLGLCAAFHSHLSIFETFGRQPIPRPTRISDIDPVRDGFGFAFNTLDIHHGPFFFFASDPFLFCLIAFVCMFFVFFLFMTSRLIMW